MEWDGLECTYASTNICILFDLCDLCNRIMCACVCVCLLKLLLHSILELMLFKTLRLRLSRMNEFK